MSNKKHLNTTVDPSVKREIDAREDLNASGLVNKLLKSYLRGEDGQEAADKLRAERLRSEAEDLENEADALRRQADQIEEQYREKERRREELWQEAVDAVGDASTSLRSVDDDLRPNPDGKAAQHWAEQLELSVSEFVEEYPTKFEEYCETDEGKGMYE